MALAREGNLNVFLSFFGKVTLVIGIFNKRLFYKDNWLEQVIISPYCYFLNYSLKQAFQRFVNKGSFFFISKEHLTLNKKGLDFVGTLFKDNLTMLLLLILER